MTWPKLRGLGYLKYIISIICLPFYQFYKKLTLQLSEHGNFLETKTINIIFVNHKVCPPIIFLVDSIPVSNYTYKKVKALKKQDSR